MILETGALEVLDRPFLAIVAADFAHLTSDGVAEDRQPAMRLPEGAKGAG